MLCSSMTGIIITAVLYFLRYTLDPGSILPACGGLTESCGFFVHSGYTVLAGVFILFLPLFCYIWIFIVSGVFALTGRENTVIAVLLFIGSVANFIISMILGFLIIHEGSICPLWIAVYPLNFLIAFFSLCILRKSVTAVSMRNLLGVISETLSGQKLIILMISILTVFMAVSTAAVTVSLTMSYERRYEIYRKDIQLTQRYLETPVRITEYPETPLMFGKGNEKVKIAVFSDPFCPPCLALTELESELERQYKGRIAVYHYLFPLDNKCNSASRGLHPYACEASRYMLAAAEMGLYDEFIRIQRSRKSELTKNYEANAGVSAIFKLMFPERNDSAGFAALSVSDKTKALLSRDIELAKNYGISHTPTVFINGREIHDSLTREILSAIIDSELRR